MSEHPNLLEHRRVFGRADAPLRGNGIRGVDAQVKFRIGGPGAAWKEFPVSNLKLSTPRVVQASDWYDADRGPANAVASIAQWVDVEDRKRWRNEYMGEWFLDPDRRPLPDPLPLGCAESIRAAFQIDPVDQRKRKLDAFADKIDNIERIASDDPALFLESVERAMCRLGELFQRLEKVVKR